uniref:Uncharacterized protein n=1 Tax=Rhizophora mucronata TaxID=61149 RepID=A0A2P2PMY2_RHIMU
MDVGFLRNLDIGVGFYNLDPVCSNVCNQRSCWRWHVVCPIAYFLLYLIPIIQDLVNQF